MGGLKSGGATVALILLLFLFGRIFPKIHSRISSSEGRIIKSVKIQSFELLNAARITGFLHWLVSAFRIAVTLLALYIYIPLVLSFFPWTSSWSPKLLGYVVTPFVTLFHVVVDYIPKLFFVIAITLITRYVLKLIRFFFAEIGQGNLRFEGFYKEWADPTYKLVRVIVVAFAFVMAFPYLPGSHSPAFQGVSVFLGLILSFGSSSAIANIVAGVVITYMRPFKIGDRVKIADTMGDVLEKNLLVTRIKTIKHVEITIPNSMVLGSHIVNYSTAAADEGLILNTTVTIGYDVPWRKVHELLIEAGNRTERVDKTKKIFVLQTALNDFYVAYELNAFTSLPNQMASIYSELHAHIQDSFNEAGVEIMSPHYGALRDGSGIAIPDSYKVSMTEAPGFKVEMKER
ncbi:MAG: mechanosensitive ion channel family protein [Proteobacteria bacterium]|nr:MAG: mechanosensitive ion channel family protein [Pseudomonadota bacterium]